MGAADRGRFVRVGVAEGGDGDGEWKGGGAAG